MIFPWFFHDLPMIFPWSCGNLHVTTTRWTWAISAPALFWKAWSGVAPWSTASSSVLVRKSRQCLTGSLLFFRKIEKPLWYTISRWWFGTFGLFFHSVGKNTPIWRTHIFQRDRLNHQPVIFILIYLLVVDWGEPLYKQNQPMIGMPQTGSFDKEHVSKVIGLTWFTVVVLAFLDKHLCNNAHAENHWKAHQGSHLSIVDCDRLS